MRWPAARRRACWRPAWISNYRCASFLPPVSRRKVSKRFEPSQTKFVTPQDLGLVVILQPGRVVALGHRDHQAVVGREHIAKAAGHQPVRLRIDIARLQVVTFAPAAPADIKLGEVAEKIEDPPKA